MLDVPPHPCDTPTGGSGRFLCTVCGQRWHHVVRHLPSRERIEGWTRSPDNYTDRTRREAYVLEQTAAAMPWTSWLARRQMLTRARTLRKIGTPNV